jgi:hypothetical protein
MLWTVGVPAFGECDFFWHAGEVTDDAIGEFCAVNVSSCC